MDRKDFFFRQLVTQAELDDAFNDVENAIKEVVKDGVGFGFTVKASHPATVEEDSPQSISVLVNELLGFDQLGNRLEGDLAGFKNGSNLGSDPHLVSLASDENGAPTDVAGGGNEKIISIFVKFARLESDSRLDGNGAPVNFEQQEAIEFKVVQSAEAPVGTAVPPPLRSDQLLLADVTRINGQTTFANSDIDQSRRQDFQLNVTHGSTHAENGTDPIPNANPVVGEGGLLSGTDKVKLDGIDFTTSGVSSLFNNRARPNQRANFTAPAATTLDVTGLMAGKVAGGDATKEGVATQSANPNNRVFIKDLNFDDLIDGSGNLVYGRITVDSEVTPTVWTLSFFSFIEGVGETPYDMTPNAGNDFQWWVTETYSLENEPTFITIPSDQLAAEIPDSFEIVTKAPATQAYQGNGIVAVAGVNPHNNFQWTEIVGDEESHPDHGTIVETFLNGIFTFRRPPTGYIYLIELVAWSATVSGGGGPNLKMELHKADDLNVERACRFAHSPSGAGGFTDAAVMVKKTIVIDDAASPRDFELWHTGSTPSNLYTFCDLKRIARVA